MIHLAADKQLPGVEIEAKDGEDEDGADELGGEGVLSGDVNWRWTWWPQEKRKAQKARGRDIKGLVRGHSHKTEI